jgi:hypothetical protein
MNIIFFIILILTLSNVSKQEKIIKLKRGILFCKEQNKCAMIEQVVLEETVQNCTKEVNVTFTFAESKSFAYLTKEGYLIEKPTIVTCSDEFVMIQIKHPIDIIFIRHNNNVIIFQEKNRIHHFFFNLISTAIDCSETESEYCDSVYRDILFVIGIFLLFIIKIKGDVWKGLVKLVSYFSKQKEDKIKKEHLQLVTSQPYQDIECLAVRPGFQEIQSVGIGISQINEQNCRSIKKPRGRPPASKN